MSSISRLLLGSFVLAHGLVHLWFVVLSQNWIKFEEAMGWTGKSWLLSSLVDSNYLRNLAAGMFSLSTFIFVIAGALLMLNNEVWSSVVKLAAILSIITLLIFWDGSFQMIVEKGLIGMLINIALIFYVVKFT